MPSVDNDGVVHDIPGRILFSLDSPHIKCHVMPPTRHPVSSEGVIFFIL